MFSERRRRHGPLPHQCHQLSGRRFIHKKRLFLFRLHKRSNMQALEFVHTFKGKKRCGFTEFVPIETLKDPVQGFLFSDILKINMELRIRSKENEAISLCHVHNSVSLVVNIYFLFSIRNIQKWKLRHFDGWGTQRICTDDFKAGGHFW